MILIQIVIISLLVFAIHYAFLPGEIFGFVDKWWDNMQLKILKGAPMVSLKPEKYKRQAQLYNLTEKLKQPLFSCPVCMVPWHGTYLYWFIPWQRLWLPAHDFVHWLIIILAAMGLNSIIVRVFKEDRQDDQNKES